jgi:L-threonylcarbamoyladenylate synthase
LQVPVFRLRQAARAVRKGGVIAYPTEAVWGLGCDPWDRDAVERILQLKARPVAKGLILVGASLEQFDWLLWDLDPAQRLRLESSWPGPVSWLVPHRNRVPPWISGEFETVALRVSAYSPVQELCRTCGGPLVSTSANVAGAQEARELYQVMARFGGGLDAIAPGRVQGLERPSVIRDLLTDTIRRGSQEAS